MSGAHSDDDRADGLTERYRAASAADPARPSDAVRESIFAYARTVAAQRTTPGVTTLPQRRPAANDSSWRISAAASVIVAAFATLLAWHLHAPMRVPAQEPDRSASERAAHPVTAPAKSSELAESVAADGRTSATPAPNAVTTRSRQRASAPAEASTPARDATAARIAGSTAAENVAGSSASDAESKLESPIAAARVPPSPAPAPANVQALPPQARDAAASARSSPVPSSPLVTAAESGNLERVDQLLRSGVSAEQTDAQGRTALLIATLRGDLTMVRRLLAAGARADAADADGDTPLAAARRQGPPELAHLLEHASHP